MILYILTIYHVTSFAQNTHYRHHTALLTLFRGQSQTPMVKQRQFMSKISFIFLFQVVHNNQYIIKIIRKFDRVYCYITNSHLKKNQFGAYVEKLNIIMINQLVYIKCSKYIVAYWPLPLTQTYNFLEIYKAQYIQYLIIPCETKLQQFY